MTNSNLTIDGVPIKSTVSAHDHSSCKGCRLGNTGKQHAIARHNRKPMRGNSTTGYSHFGEQVDTDICEGFEPSFPHGFIAMINFDDRWSAEKGLYFLTAKNQQQVSSCLSSYVSDNSYRLRNGKIGRWQTDNGKMMTGEEVVRPGRVRDCREPELSSPERLGHTARS